MNSEIGARVGTVRQNPAASERLRGFGTTVALLAAFLAGCGGGSSCRAPVLPIKIQLFGDSTQYGPTAASRPSVLLQAALDTEFGKGIVAVENRAVPGSDSTELILGTDGLNKPWPQSVDASIIVVNHGINDVTRNLSPDAYEKNLQAFASTQGVRVIFETPNTTHPADGGPNTDAFAQIMRNVASAAGDEVADTNAFTAPLSPWRNYYYQDGVHPNASTTASIVSSVLEPAVQSQVEILCQ